MNTYIKLFLSIVICLAVGAVSGYITAPEITGWYTSLNKPFFNPPNELFGPVWTTLYILMGFSFWIIWSSDAFPASKNKAIAFFVIQLILNFLWSIIFFHFHRMDIAFIEILILWLTILLTMVSFKTISNLAYYLLVPYFAWVSFAMVLNLAFWKLN